MKFCSESRPVFSVWYCLIMKHSKKKKFLNYLCESLSMSLPADITTTTNFSAYLHNLFFPSTASFYGLFWHKDNLTPEAVITPESLTWLVWLPVRSRKKTSGSLDRTSAVVEQADKAGGSCAAAKRRSAVVPTSTTAPLPAALAAASSHIRKTLCWLNRS